MIVTRIASSAVNATTAVWVNSRMAARWKIIGMQKPAFDFSSELGENQRRDKETET